MAGSWLLPFNLFRLRNIKHCCVVSTISMLPTLVVELPPSALPSPGETRESPFHPFGLALAHVPSEIKNFFAIYAERLNCTLLALAY